MLQSSLKSSVRASSIASVGAFRVWSSITTTIFAAVFVFTISLSFFVPIGFLSASLNMSCFGLVILPLLSRSKSLPSISMSISCEP